MTERAPKRDKLGDFLFKIFGPATVEGALQGWSPQAQDQWKRLQANARRAKQEHA